LKEKEVKEAVRKHLQKEEKYFLQGKEFSIGFKLLQL
jgi:hypothetical protein